MAKTSGERLQQALEAIRTLAGEDEYNEIHDYLKQHVGQCWVFADALELGGAAGTGKSTAEKTRRNAMRGLLLAGLVKGRIQVIGVGQVRTELTGLSTEELGRRIRGLFPFKNMAGSFANRAYWNPQNFTDPKAHNPASYRYVVHGIQNSAAKIAERGAGSNITPDDWNHLTTKYGDELKEIKKQAAGTVMEKEHLWVKFYRQYFLTPNVIQSKLMSCSVIDQDHHATYYPFGFILKVPPQNVYSTAGQDQAVKNHAADLLNALSTVFHDPGKAGGRIWTPDEVLNATNQAEGETGYNEVVVVGTAPEGSQIEVIGIFYKTDGNGNLYLRSGNGGSGRPDLTPYLNDEIWRLMNDCKVRYSIPLVPIVDRSGAPSKFPVPKSMSLGAIPTSTGARY